MFDNLADSMLWSHRAASIIIHSDIAAFLSSHPLHGT